QETQLPISALKILAKGKVLPDTRTVEEVVDEQGKATLMVMIASGATPAPAAPAAVAEETKVEIEGMITDDVWTAIKDAVVGKLGEVNGHKVMDRIKRGYDLAK
ncbi:hypothetical protein V1525DRAFT_349730, partial [Lipomyces kononenkoae]